MKTLLILTATLLLASPSHAQWSIVSVSSSEMEKQTTKTTTDFWLNITIKNDSDKKHYIWGQRGFHIIESFIKSADSQTWERQNIGICGTMGEPSWQPVEPGAEIKLTRRLSTKDIGNSLMLTFQMSPTPNGVRENSEVLLGSFVIPSFAAKQ
jgi:hypothetical protein